MKELIISSFVPMAMTEKQGMVIRNEIEKYIKIEDVIILDFSNIHMYATMFFNAIIGYYARVLTPQGCIEKIKLSNISDLGQDTFNHSFENAKVVIKNKNSDEIADITAQTISET